MDCGNNNRDNAYDGGRMLNIAKFCLNRSSLIEASAGTGKTFTITYLVLRLLLGSDTQGTGYRTGKNQRLTPLEIEKILVVTFTNASASDLGVRIRQTVRDARIIFEKIAKADFPAQGDPKAPLEKVLGLLSVGKPLDEIITDLLLRQQETPYDLKASALQCARILQRAERNIDRAPICTIHSFCNRALNQIYAFEAGQAFNVQLTTDISEFTAEAQNNVWRKLFYLGDEKQSRLILDILGTSSPNDVFGSKNCLEELNKVRSEDPDEDFFGFCLQIKLLLEKLKTDFGVELLLEERQCGNGDKLYEQILKITACYEKFCQKQALLPLKLKDLAKKMFLERDPVPFFLEHLAEPGDNKPDTAGTLFKNKTFLKGVNAFVTCLYKLKQGGDPDFEDKRLKLSPSLKFGGIVRNAKKNVADFDNDAYTDDHAAARLFEERLFEAFGLVAKISKKNDLKKILSSLLQYLLAIEVFYERLRLCRKHNIISTDDVIWQLNRVLKSDIGKRARPGTLCSMLRERYPVAMIDEFQDTDPIQFGIFSKIYLAKGNHDAKCYLIGDPKQSIYAFRGSDINSYLQAKAMIAKTSEGLGLYTMNTNFRSASSVVGAVNLLFGSKVINPQLDRPFSLNAQDPHVGSIDFAAVAADDSINCGKPRLYFAPGGLDAFKLSQDDFSGLPGVYFNIVGQGQGLSKSALNRQQAKSAALSVLHCLAQGFLVQKSKAEEKFQYRRVTPGDIAVLVRTRHESEIIQKALSVSGIKSVFYSNRESVLSSPSAKLISYVMDAMCEPTNLVKLRLLLGSRLLGFDGEEFKRHCREDFLAQEIILLKESAAIWRSSGFLSAFSHWFQHGLHDSIRRFLRLQNGERALTDLYHLCEIVQGVHHKLKGLKPQQRWFADLVAKGGDAEFIQRLESENLQIKIITLHGCKGLEYPIVIMPFLHSSNERPSSKIDYGLTHPGLVYYDRTLKRRRLDLGCDVVHLSQLDSDNSLEDMRLLYVALTRAKAAMFLYPSELKVKAGTELSAFAKLLGADKGETIEELKLHLHQDGASGLFMPEFDSEPSFDDLSKSLPQSPCDYVSAAPSVLENGAVLKDFQISSYTKVVTGKHASLNDIEESKLGDDDTAVEAQPPGQDLLPIAQSSFPKGASGGTFMHEMLEKCRFDLISSDAKEACAQSLELANSNSKYKFLLKRWSYEYEAAGKPLQGQNEILLWLENIAAAKINRSFSLNQLKKGDYLQEMRYLLPAYKLNIEEFERRVCINNAYFFKNVLGQDLIDNLKLKPDIVRGFITGSLDLVCRFPLNGDRKHFQYFVIDYKSNFLGNAFSDYGYERLVKSIFASRYDVQFLFYTLALHRFLKQRVADYDYQRDFGGVIYLYLRGLKAGDNSGVFCFKPDFESIDLLDRLFLGRNS